MTIKKRLIYSETEDECTYTIGPTIDGMRYRVGIARVNNIPHIVVYSRYVGRGGQKDAYFIDRPRLIFPAEYVRYFMDAALDSVTHCPSGTLIHNEEHLEI